MTVVSPEHGVAHEALPFLSLGYGPLGFGWRWLQRSQYVCRHCFLAVEGYWWVWILRLEHHVGTNCVLTGIVLTHGLRPPPSSSGLQHPTAGAAGKIPLGSETFKAGMSGLVTSNQLRGGSSRSC